MKLYENMPEFRHSYLLGQSQGLLEMIVKRGLSENLKEEAENLLKEIQEAMESERAE